MGPLDNRLKAVGLEMPPDFYVEMARAGKAPDGGSDNLFEGQLLIDPQSSTLSDQIENALDQPDKKFIEARDAFHRIDRRIMQRILAVIMQRFDGYAALDGGFA
jgi:hypothetical protein